LEVERDERLKLLIENKVDAGECKKIEEMRSLVEDFSSKLKAKSIKLEELQEEMMKQ
jgi:hypothetical protein